MVERTSQRRAARAVVLLLTLLGLVAMHGLPHAMTGSSGPTSMAAGVVMPSPLATPMTTSQHAYTQPNASARPISSAPTACGMDHSQCVAVLRDAGHLSAPAAAATVSPMPGTAPPATLPARGPKVPPDVSLVELGISRT